MSTIFIIDTTNQASGLELADRIRRINPDKIIMDSETECGADVIFKDFFDSIEPWLEQNNKIVNILTPHLDNVCLRPRVIGEMGYANTLRYLGEMIKNDPEQDPPDGYYLTNSIAPYFGNLDEKYFDILYTCYNHQPTLHRKILVDTLARDNLLGQGIVTFHHPEGHNWQYHDGSRLFDESDYVIYSTPQYYPKNFPKSFHKGFFDIVGESHYEHKQITEKTLKSIVMFKPFLVNGCKGFHSEYLFDYMGLKPYTEIFDYSFDNYNSIESRVEGIVSNVKRLAKLTVSERKQLYRDIIPKLIYNKSKMVELLYSKEKIIPRSLQGLMDGNPHRVYGTSYLIVHMQEMGWIKENVTWVN